MSIVHLWCQVQVYLEISENLKVLMKQSESMGLDFYDFLLVLYRFSCSSYPNGVFPWQLVSIEFFRNIRLGVHRNNSLHSYVYVTIKRCNCGIKCDWDGLFGNKHSWPLVTSQLVRAQVCGHSREWPVSCEPSACFWETLHTVGRDTAPFHGCTVVILLPPWIPVMFISHLWLWSLAWSVFPSPSYTKQTNSNNNRTIKEMNEFRISIKEVLSSSCILFLF